MRVIFTGAQGTGKTTILDLIPNENKITNICRSLAKDGVKINEMGDDASQKIIFDTYYELLKQDEYISDRGLTDVLAYSRWLYENGRLGEDEYNRELSLFDDFIKKYPAVYFYFPIEFNVEDDGVRSCDEGFRNAINNNINGLLLKHKRTTIDSYTVRGSVENRLKFIQDVLYYHTVLN